jgi:hypothetical protein
VGGIITAPVIIGGSANFSSPDTVACKCVYEECKYIFTRKNTDKHIIFLWIDLFSWPTNPLEFGLMLPARILHRFGIGCIDRDLDCFFHTSVSD